MGAVFCVFLGVLALWLMWKGFMEIGDSDIF